jgi:hypothetical protein
MLYQPLAPWVQALPEIDFQINPWRMETQGVKQNGKINRIPKNDRPGYW